MKLRSILPMLACLICLASCAGTGTNREDTAKIDLAGTSWVVEDVAGRGVIDGTRTMLSFGEAGRVSGSTGCNNLTGAAAISGREIKFGPCATTRRACPEAVMDQEQRFLSALEAVRRWSLDSSGILLLKDAGGATLLRLSRVSE